MSRGDDDHCVGGFRHNKASHERRNRNRPQKTYHGEDINKKNVKNLLTSQSKNVIIKHKLKIVEKKGLNYD